MSGNNKIFMGFMALALAAGVGSAARAEDRVLFKIHDIVPIKNADGNVVSCEMGATFYNRSSKDFLNAALTLVWADDVVAETINQEERNSRENKYSSKKKTPRYGTATYDSGTISHNLRLPSLKAKQQLTLKSKIATDKCFLLLNDMEINVTDCSLSDLENSSACNNMFRFIGPKNAEYYSEFKQISPEEEEKQRILQKEKQEDANERLYENTIKAIKTLEDQIEDAQKTYSGSSQKE